MIDLLIGKETYSIPTKLDECNAWQMATYAREFILGRNSIFTEGRDGSISIKNRMLYEVAMMRLLHATTGCEWKLFTKISAEQKHYLVYEEKLLEFYFTGNFTQAPHICISGLIGPDNEYQLTAEEFSFADTAYIAYHRTESAQALNTFAATLLRPKQKFTWLFKPANGDKREVFNKHSIDARLAIVATMPTDYKLALWFWYHKYRVDMPDKYPFAFGGGNESKAASSGWLDVLLSSAENGTFGNYKQTCETQHHLVFSDMNRRIQNSKTKPYA
jgi:hypothetical protein